MLAGDHFAGGASPFMNDQSGRVKYNLCGMKWTPIGDVVGDDDEPKNVVQMGKLNNGTYST